MSGTRVVVISAYALVMYPPVANGQLRFHFPMWTRSGSRTYCGRPIDGWTRMRQDIAELFADPCPRCYPASELLGWGR